MRESREVVKTVLIGLFYLSVPLLNVLSTHLRIIANLPMEWRCWARLCIMTMDDVNKEEGAGPGW